jgi:hypothetical protein
MSNTFARMTEVDCLRQEYSALFEEMHGCLPDDRLMTVGTADELLAEIGRMVDVMWDEASAHPAWDFCYVAGGR